MAATDILKEPGAPCPACGGRAVSFQHLECAGSRWTCDAGCGASGEIAVPGGLTLASLAARVTALEEAERRRVLGGRALVVHV